MGATEKTEQRGRREGTYPDGGVLRGCDQRLGVLAELAVQHRFGVSQQSG